MQKKKYEPPKVKYAYALTDVIRTSDLYVLDEYDPDEWQDVNLQS